jgi:hypothetical protein
MLSFHTNRPDHKILIRSTLSFWGGTYHNEVVITVTATKFQKSEIHKFGYSLSQEKMDEFEHWVKIGKIVSELMDKLDIKRKLDL